MLYSVAVVVKVNVDVSHSRANCMHASCVFKVAAATTTTTRALSEVAKDLAAEVHLSMTRARETDRGKTRARAGQESQSSRVRSRRGSL